MKRISMKTAFVAFAAMMAVASGVTMTRAQAAEMPMNELEGSSNAILTFGTNANTTFSLAAGYSRALNEMFQGSIILAFADSSRPVGNVKALVAEIGPTFNLALDNTGIRNAVYLRATGGIAYASDSSSGTSVSSTNFAYAVELGKRFELWSVVSWKPAFNVSGTTATGANPLFAFIPAQFAFTF
jgi:hypothetical protein